MAYADCESVRGDWGKPCPDCGQILPNPKPLASWMSMKHSEAPQPRHKKGTPFVFAPKPERMRISKVPVISKRMQQVLDLLRENGGNKTRTAQQLGISVQGVQSTVYRAKLAGVDA